MAGLVNRNLQPAQFSVSEYEGRTGEPSHITRTEYGMVPVAWVAAMHGRNGEVPGEHRNRQGEDWDRYKADIAANGIQSPIFVTKDYGQEPRLSEGSHRRDAAVELGHSHIPAEIRYFGHSEHEGLVGR